MNLCVLLGPPGSGKGTQAKRISKHNGSLHLSTGDVLRHHIKGNTELGKKAKGFIDKGQLVPDDVMIELIKDVLSKQDQKITVLLDGFPRTVTQARALDGMSVARISHVVEFNIDNSELFERLTGRRTCSKCSEPYHIKFAPPKITNTCDKCGGTLTQRTDDTADVVSQRLTVYEKQTAPLLQYYTAQGKLVQINAGKSMDEVFNSFVEALENGKSNGKH